MAGGRPRQGESPKLNLSISDAWLKDLVRAVITFEAHARRRSKGQACYELVMEAVDVESYPPELRQRLAELEEESNRRAVERTLHRSVGAGRAGDGIGD